MKKPRHQHSFNIIEIALTLAIMGFAMSAIMAIFPIGFSVTRDTMTQNYASDIGDQVLSYIQIQANRPSTGWSSTFNSSKWNQARPPLDPAPSGVPNEVPIGSNSNATLKCYGTVTLPGGDCSSYKYFQITRSTLVGTQQVTEMTAIAQLWDPDIADTTTTQRVFIEISWPAEKSYADRTKLTMCKQILNLN